MTFPILFFFSFKDYQKYQAKVLKLQEREKTPQIQAKLEAVGPYFFRHICFLLHVLLNSLNYHWYFPGMFLIVYDNHLSVSLYWHLH